jgi:hypothetical protein
MTEMPGGLSAMEAARLAMTPGSAVGVFAPDPQPPLTGMPVNRPRTPQAFPGSVAHPCGPGRTFADDFYWRMHVFPQILDAGNLTEKAVFDVEVFNAWMEHVTLQSVTQVSGDGMDLAGFSPPQLVRATLSATGTLTVSMDGPPDIDGSFSFSFSTGEVSAIRVVGNRIVTFALPPDWSRKVTERLSFLTDVMESRDGTEQRLSMRARPRWSMEYTVLEGGTRVNLLDSLVAGWGSRAFLVPVWWMKSALTAPATAGETEIRCPTAGRGFAAGAQAVLWRDPLTCEAVPVASVAPDSVTLARPVGRDYPEAYLIPARMCRLDASTSQGALASSLVEAKVRFEAEDPDGTAPAQAGDVLEGKDVFPFRHDWTAAKQRTTAWQYFTWDSGQGLPLREPRRRAPADVMEVRDALLPTREEAEGLKAWAVRQMGRGRSFWALVEEDQLVPSRGVELGGLSLHVRNGAYGLLASASESRNRLFLRAADGRRHVFRVGSHQELSGGEHVLHVDPPWPWSVPLDRISRIGFVVLARFDHDDFELERRQDVYARASLTLRGVLN